MEPVVAAYGTDLEHDLEAATYYVDSGNVATRTDANGNLTQYVYDGHARLYRVYYPDKSAPLTPSTNDYEEYAYDANGNVTSLRLRDATTITYQYDALNRQIVGMQSSVYAYDNLSRLTSTSRQSRTVSYTYDAFDNVLTETQPAGTVTYTYDLAGRRLSMAWPDGQYVSYDWYGGPDMLTQDINGSYHLNLTTYHYDELGRITRAGRSNGTYTDYTFDARSALSTLVTNVGGSGTAYDQTVTYGRDAATRITGRTGTNSLYEWAPGSASPSTYVNNGLNQTTSAGGLSLTYDDRGNMTSDGTSTYTYDVANHLTGMSRTGASASLAYDPVGRLYEIAPSGGTTTRFLYDGVDLIGEYDTSGNVLRRYVHGPRADEPVIWYEGSTTAGTQWYLHADERGSIIAVSQGASVLSTATYDAYGARSTSNPTYTPRFGFTGQEWLSELGLYYYKARMYSPTLGRFLQTDPIGYGDGMNLYAYVRNDPVNFTDPTGNKTECRWVAEYDWNLTQVSEGEFDSDLEQIGETLSCREVEDDPGLFADNYECPSYFSAENCNQQIVTRGLLRKNAPYAAPVIVAEYALVGGGIAAVAALAGGAEGVAAMAGRACNCFEAGTLVATVDGSRPIEQIKVGDLVLSRDETTGQTAYKPVVALIAGAERDIYDVTAKTTSGKLDTIHTTEEHPFRTADGRWTEAAKLKAGDIIITASGQATVTSVKRTNRIARTYNFEVADYHTYFVGRTGVWVHNACFSAVETAGLKQLFGQGMNGARAAASKFMAGNGALPAGVTTATLQAYKAAVTAAGPATANAPVNVLRLFVVDTLLGLK